MDTFRHGYSSNEHLLPHYHLANPRFEDDQQQQLSQTIIYVEDQ